MEKLAKMTRVFMTGHKGYIGSVLCPVLQKAGFDVFGWDSDLYERCTFGERALDVPGVGKDIRDVKFEDLKGFDAVIHLAGLSNDPLGDIDEALTYDINFHATVDLAKKAKKAGVSRFIFSSSCSNYGRSGSALIDENAPLNPVTAYGRSKVFAEKGLAELASDAFSPICLRNGTVYGCSPKIRFDLVVNNLVAWAHDTGKIHLKSDGSAWRPLVHVEDVALAFLACLRAPRRSVHNMAFNVGLTQENFQILEVAKRVHKAVPKCELEYAQGATADARSYKVSCERIREVLPKWQPKWNLNSGIEQVYGEIQKHGLTLEDFEGPRYCRVKHIKHLIDAGELAPDLRRIDVNSEGQIHA